MPIASRGFLPHRLVVAALLMLAQAAWAAEPLPAGKGVFEFRDALGRPDKPVTVWYDKPVGATPPAHIVFVMTGTKRDGEHFRDFWAPYAERAGFLLVVPEFPAKLFPVREYQFGNLRDPEVSHWSFAVIEHLFDRFKAAGETSAEAYDLFGHSAGAQFVHRFMLFMPSPRVELAISANAGDYTLPVYPEGKEAPFPWRLDARLVPETQLKAVLQRPLVVMLGDKDTDPNHRYLPKSPEAMAQGPYRLARGEFFFDTARQQAERLHTPFGWTLVHVPGVGHSDKHMSEAAARYLIDAWQKGEAGAH